MRWFDLAGLALQALGAQKVRTALTLLGVIVSSALLMVSLSIGLGVQEVVRDAFRRDGRLRQVHVNPYYERYAESEIPPVAVRVRGAMSDAKRDRIRKTLVRKWQQANPKRVVRLTREALDDLATRPHVASAVPGFAHQYGQASWSGHLGQARLAVVSDRAALAPRLVAGAVFPGDADRAVLVTEELLYRWGVTDEADVARVVGQPLRIDLGDTSRMPQLVGLLGADVAQLTTTDQQALEKVLQQLPTVLPKLDLSAGERASLRRLFAKKAEGTTGPRAVVHGEYAIAGVLREADPEEGESRPWFAERDQDNGDVLLPREPMAELFRRHPDYEKYGYPYALLTVDSEENVRAVVEAVRQAGFREHSLLDFADRVHHEITLIRVATTFVSVVALIVAALGITNTLVTSVLERTREIGIMKAVGAKDRQVQWLFLVEGALIGLLGGALGLLLAYGASLLGDDWARSVMEKQSEQKVLRSMFVFPPSLVAGVPLFCGLVTTLAAWFPARRAARIDPAIALRSE